jgi:hypothetical protein
MVLPTHPPPGLMLVLTSSADVKGGSAGMCGQQGQEYVSAQLKIRVVVGGWWLEAGGVV